jgi:methylenetetrahydrofolate reductase (NADPH)
MITRIHLEGGIQGFHFCTLNLEKSVQRILEALRWTWQPPLSLEKNKLIVVGITLELY